MGKKIFTISLFEQSAVAYATPVLLVVLATCFKLSYFRYTSYNIAFLLYFLVMLISGFIAGIKGATTALCAAAICTFNWLIPLTEKLGRYTTAELLLFLGEGIAIMLLFWWNGHWMRKLDKSEQKYRRIIDQGAEAFFLCDAQLNINLASAAAFRLFQKSKEEIQSKTLLDLVHPDERSAFELTCRRLQNQGNGTAILQQRILCSNGEWCWTECSINNLLNDPLVAGLIVQMRDITDRINQQRHQEDFVNMASHELKSPITAIRGFLQIAVKRWAEGKRDDQPLYLGRVQAQTDKLLGLIDDMLNITRIKAGELAYHFEPIDLGGCLQEAVAAITAGAPERHVEMNIAAGLPAVKADPVRISQVATNLLSNALKYSPADTPVKVALCRKNDCLEVSVCDRGIGIPADHLQKVFDRFYRVDALVKGKYEGLGLGLFIAAEIIRKHRGQICVDSEEGKGAVFSFLLPLAEC